MVLVFKYGTLIPYGFLERAPEDLHLVKSLATHKFVFDPSPVTGVLLAVGEMHFLKILTDMIESSHDIFHPSVKHRKLVIVGWEQIFDPVGDTSSGKRYGEENKIVVIQARLQRLVATVNQASARANSKDPVTLVIEFVTFREYIKHHDWENEVGRDIARNMLRLADKRVKGDEKLARKAERALMRATKE